MRVYISPLYVCVCACGACGVCSIHLLVPSRVVEDILDAPAHKLQEARAQDVDKAACGSNESTIQYRTPPTPHHPAKASPRPARLLVIVSPFVLVA